MHLHNLFEVHYKDLYPKTFDEFRKKYRKKASSGEWYVQFTDRDNTMDRTAYETPDHSDPVGTYAYPLKYVINHPADVWYGQAAKYLRVLKRTTNNVFNITEEVEDEDDVHRLWREFGWDYTQRERFIKIIRKNYRDRLRGSRKTLWAKIFFQAIQVDLTAEPEEQKSWGESKKVYPIRSGLEQTKLLKMLNIRAIEDTSRNYSQAVINDREPNQIIFLDRSGFRVEEVFPLRPNAKERDLPPMTTIDPSAQVTERPLVANIASIMDGDKPKQGPERSSLNGWSYYWTKKGRRIEILFDIPSGYYDNLNFGEKRHKANKLTNEHLVRVKIKSEYGNIEKSYSNETRFEDIVVDLEKLWRDKKNNPTPGWTPETRELFHKKIQDERKARIWKKIQAERLERQKEIPDFVNLMKWASNHFKIPFSTFGDPVKDERLVDRYQDLHKTLKYNDLEDALNAEIKAINRVEPEILPKWNQVANLLKAAYQSLDDETRNRSFNIISDYRNSHHNKD